MSRHVSVTFGDDKNLTKKSKTPFFRYATNIVDGKNKVHEIVCGKRRQTDCVPVQIAFTILCHAKQHVLEFFNMLRLHVNTSAVRLCYMGI